MGLTQIYWSGTTVGNAPGFLLTMQDGQQTFSSADPTLSVIAEVSTDAHGNIIAPWWVQMCGTTGNLDNCISTADNPGAQGVQDYGQTIFTDTQYNSGSTLIPGTNPPAGVPGAWFQARSGTATWFHLEGDDFGIPFGPYEQVTGGDDLPNSTQWNFEIPAGWTYGHGQLNVNGTANLSAGAYAASSGPCIGGFSCTVATGAARGLAYETFTNTGPATNIKLNAALEGGFINSSGGVANAAVYVVDAGVFANAVPAGAAAATFLLGNTSIDDFVGPSPTLSLVGLFPAVLATSTTTEQATAGSNVNVPIVTGLYPVAAGASFTVIFDVAAYAPAGTIGGGPATVNFANTLAPASVMFTDASGNAVTQIEAIAPPLTSRPALATLALSPTTTSSAVDIPATVTVTATDSNGNPLPNATVFFSVSSGPNSPISGPELTNANGQAAFTYTGGGAAGTDSIQASAGAVLSNAAAVTWSTPGSLDHITISPTSSNITPGGSQPYVTQAFDKFGNLIATVTSSTSFAITPDGSCTLATCTASTLGPHTVTATYSGDTAQASLNVGSSLSTPTITFGAAPTPTYLGGNFTVSATTNSDGALTYTYVSGPCAQVVGGTFSSSGAGTCVIQANTAATSTYSAGSAQQSVIISAATPTITFGTAPTPTYLGGNFTVSATTNSTAAITYSYVSGPCAQVSGGTFSSSGAGTCVIKASTAATTNFAAGSATQNVIISAATPTLSFGAAPSPTYLGGNFTVSATTNSNGALTYSYVSGPCAQVSGATFSSSGAGTCVVRASTAATTNFSPATVNQNVTINPATPTITFGAAPSATYPGSNFTVSATTNSNGALSYSYVSGPCTLVSGGTFSPTGVGSCVVQASTALTTNFLAGSAKQSVTIVAAGQTQTFTITPSPAAETVSRGVVGGFLLKLQSVDGFDANVTLSCSGGPAGSYCVDFPMTVKVNGTAYAVSGILFPEERETRHLPHHLHRCFGLTDRQVDRDVHGEVSRPGCFDSEEVIGR